MVDEGQRSSTNYIYGFRIMHIFLSYSGGSYSPNVCVSVWNKMQPLIFLICAGDGISGGSMTHL